MKKFSKFLLPIELLINFANYAKHLDKSKVALKDSIESLNKIYANIINKNLG